jgi:hypothetical protein
MRANASWDNHDRSVVRYDMLHGWTWHDLMLAVSRVQRLERDEGRRIDVLIDMRQVEPVDHATLFSLEQISNGRAFARLVACCPRLIAIVGAAPMIRAMFNHYYAACTVDEPNATFTDDLYEARERIAAEQRRDIVYAVVASA